MSTSPITATTPVSAADSSTNTSSSTSSTDRTNDGLGENAFLQLLITQMTHQDPTQPQDSTQMLMQLATFSQLEQLTQMNTSLQQLVTLAGGTSSSSSTSDKQ